MGCVYGMNAYNGDVATKIVKCNVQFNATPSDVLNIQINEVRGAYVFLRKKQHIIQSTNRLDGHATGCAPMPTQQMCISSLRCTEYRHTID